MDLSPPIYSKMFYANLSITPIFNSVSYLWNRPKYIDGGGESFYNFSKSKRTKKPLYTVECVIMFKHLYFVRFGFFFVFLASIVCMVVVVYTRFSILSTSNTHNLTCGSNKFFFRFFFSTEIYAAAVAG